MRRARFVRVALLAALTGVLCLPMTAPAQKRGGTLVRSEEHTSELQSQSNLVCRLLLGKKSTQSAYQPVRLLGSVSHDCVIVPVFVSRGHRTWWIDTEHVWTPITVTTLIHTCSRLYIER